MSQVKTFRNRWIPFFLGFAVFTALPASATPVVVVDVDTQAVLHEEDAGAPWYPASTTKLMTTFLVFEALRAGQVTLDAPVTMSANAMKQPFLESGLSVGRTMTLENALFATITASANDVAFAIAERIGGDRATFVQRMNEAAARLGLTGSYFTNPNGLFDKAQHTTARDLALLGITIDREFPEYRRFFRATGVTIDGKKIDSNNQLLTRFAGTIGMKTGFLCASGRNIVALTEREGKRLMVVMLGATTERERSERSAQLLTQAFAGSLHSNAGSLKALPNHPEIQPEDMRMRLCSNQSAAYEVTREAMYPMGLPGNESYLGPAGTGEIHDITTWLVETAPAVPLPAPRPSSL